MYIPCFNSKILTAAIALALGCKAQSNTRGLASTCGEVPQG
jgi:hypothetical protein